MYAHALHTHTLAHTHKVHASLVCFHLYFLSHCIFFNGNVVVAGAGAAASNAASAVAPTSQLHLFLLHKFII